MVGDWLRHIEPMGGEFLGELPPLNGRAGGRPATARGRALRDALKPGWSVEPRLTSNYLVKGWLDRGASSVLYGGSNVGKSFLVLDLALHVAAGASWHGSRVPCAQEIGPVIYIAGEGGGSFDNRIAAWIRSHPEHAEAIRDRFFILPIPVDLRGREDARELVAMLAESRPSLIVIDTLARSMGEGSENEGADMGAFIRSIDHIRAETGAHVMVIHHSGKDQARGARGHTSLKGAVDTEIEVTRSEGVIQATASKQRDMSSGKVFAFRLRQMVLGLDQDGDEVTSCSVEPTEPIEDRPKLTARQVIAMQALDDAIAHYGERRSGDLFPHNRHIVTVERWREFCDRHTLSDGESDSARRMAFKRARDSLHKKGLIRQIDGYVWKVPPTASHRHTPSQVTQCDAVHSSVTSVTPPYKGCDGVTVHRGERMCADGHAPSGPVHVHLPAATEAEEGRAGDG